MQITFNLPHVFNSASSAEDNARALRALMECLVSINLAYLKSNPSTPPLYRSGVRYFRTLWWEAIPALYASQRGDCKSLSAALIAQYRIRGLGAKPVFRFVKNSRSGGTDYHILVQTERGYEDPSKVLGMGEDENRYFNGGGGRGAPLVY